MIKKNIKIKKIPKKQQKQYIKKTKKKYLKKTNQTPKKAN